LQKGDPNIPANHVVFEESRRQIITVFVYLFDNKSAKRLDREQELSNRESVFIPQCDKLWLTSKALDCWKGGGDSPALRSFDGLEGNTSTYGGEYATWKSSKPAHIRIGVDFETRWRQAMKNSISGFLKGQARPNIRGLRHPFEN
jgi:hypothetical protein